MDRVWERLRGGSGSSKSRRGEGRGTWCGGGRATLCMLATGHYVEHVACGEVGKVGAELSRLRSDLDLGPKSKVATQEQLYKFHFGAMVIRVVD